MELRLLEVEKRELVAKVAPACRPGEKRGQGAFPGAAVADQHDRAVVPGGGCGVEDNVASPSGGHLQVHAHLETEQAEPARHGQRLERLEIAGQAEFRPNPSPQHSIWDGPHGKVENSVRRAVRIVAVQVPDRVHHLRERRSKMEGCGADAHDARGPMVCLVHSIRSARSMRVISSRRASTICSTDASSDPSSSYLSPRMAPISLAVSTLSWRISRMATTAGATTCVMPDGR